MFQFLHNFSEFITLKIGLDLTTRAGKSVSFFIEDTVKIFFLIYAMLFLVSLFRDRLSPEKIKNYLSGKHSFFGYALAVMLGVVTPFCSCSSIPLFIGFVAAGVPFGVTMAFLISSPLISEVATALLITMPEAGLKVAIIYVFAGALISILGGWLCDVFKLERFIDEDYEPPKKPCCCCGSVQEKIKSTVKYANNYAFDTVKSIALWVVAGLALGALMHGYVPQEFFVKYLGKNNFFAVPVAAVVGIPIYANHNSVLPIIQVLLMKGVPVGTAMVMLMSITAISLPELIMLRRVLKWEILAMFVAYLFLAFIFVGYLLNWVM